MAAISRVEVVANIASGGVGETAPDEIRKILSDFGVRANVCAPATEDLARCLRDAVDAAPDLLIILAGDGTARAAAELCGADGPLLAPLPGGTMNMLPHAVYGERSWPEALGLALTEGQPRTVGGGSVEGHTFLVAAILGAPALWAPAREAARMHRPRLALRRARRALRRAFTGRLRYNLDSGPREKAEALVFLCPLASRALDESAQALEAAALDLDGAADAFRLGVHALVGDWRDSPSVHAEPCRIGRVWAAGPIPAILDGESVQLKSLTEVAWRPAVVRLLALPPELR